MIQISTFVERNNFPNRIIGLVDDNRGYVEFNRDNVTCPIHVSVRQPFHLFREQRIIDPASWNLDEDYSSRALG